MTSTFYHQTPTSDSQGVYCLDYVGKSQKVRPARTEYRAEFRFRQYANELEVTTVAKGATAPHPLPGRRGKRQSRGVSPAGKKLIRRAVNGIVAKRRATRCVMLTLTTQHQLSDKDFKGYVTKWFHSARAAAPKAFKHYVLAYELQKRGVLHCHILLFDLIPYEAFKRLRNLWAEKYELGAGGVDAKQQPLDNARAAAYYVSKLTWYISKDSDAEAEKTFFGNAYAMSQSMYQYAKPVCEFNIPYSRCADVFSLMNHSIYGNQWAAYFYMSESDNQSLLEAFSLAPPDTLGSPTKALKS
jgi:hypothetical protein